jgi:6-pyruvoyltetrahydropterin/6-carboxytetrahydropterin synthase
MSTPNYTVRVTKDHLVFSAAHFITFNGNICERLHGHNWRLAATVTGPLDENSYVFDFIALRDGLQRMVEELDHRMLVATQHPTIKVNASDKEVELTFEERRWIFPAEECVLLPIANTTAELLATWIAGRIVKDLSLADSQLTELTIEVEENFGQWAVCRLPIEH